jgi:hypothetical protein
VGGAVKGQHHPSGGGMADSLDFLQMQQLQQQVVFPLLLLGYTPSHCVVRERARCFSEPGRIKFPAESVGNVRYQRQNMWLPHWPNTRCRSLRCYSGMAQRCISGCVLVAFCSPLRLTRIFVIPIQRQQEGLENEVRQLQAEVVRLRRLCKNQVRP